MLNLVVPTGWKLTKLSDLGEVNRGRSRHRPRDAKHLYGGPYPFVQTGDVKASKGRINRYTQTYSEAGLAQSRLWPKGTMCITIAANIAETGILEYPACFPDSVIGFIPDPTKCNVYFIEYVFRVLRKQIQAQATGSVQDNINLQTLELLEFPVPEVEEQNRLASILCKFDDKIHINTQTNQTLESIAQAIFKSWFVDFDPVKAKMAAKKRWHELQPTSESASPVCYADEAALPDLETYTNFAAICAISGKNETELTQLQQQNPDHYQQLAETAALFPSAMVGSELGEIPEGWEVRPLYDTAEYINGGAFKTEHFSQDQSGLPIIKIAELKQGITHSTKFTHKDFNKKISVDNGDILYSWSGSPETSLEVFKWFGGKGWLNQHIFKLSFESEDDKIFTFYLLKFLKPLLIETAKQKQTTGLGHITVADMKRIQTVSPSPMVLREFCYMVSPMFNKSSSLDIENMQLSQLRDSLLPKLLSGEIDPNEIQSEVA